MTWNTDLSTAPRGRTITGMRNTRTKDGVVRVPVQEFEPEHVWVATKCLKVLKSYWIPATDKNEGRWGGLATKEEPIAWQLYIVPTHPNFESASGASAQAGVRGLAPVKAAAPLSDREYVERIADRVIAERSDLGLNIVTKHSEINLPVLDDVGGGV